MNTMVGMQTSLHTSVSEDISGTMKNGSSHRTSAESDLADVFDNDEFDPDELLKSPLFNDSSSDDKLSKSIGDDLFGAFTDDSNQNRFQQQQTAPTVSPESSDEMSIASTTSAVENHDYMSMSGRKQQPATSLSTPTRSPVKRSASASCYPPTLYESRAGLQQAQAQMFNQQHQQHQHLQQHQQLQQHQHQHQQMKQLSHSPVRRVASDLPALGRDNLSPLSKMRMAMQENGYNSRSQSPRHAQGQRPQSQQASPPRRIPSQSMHGVPFAQRTLSPPVNNTMQQMNSMQVDPLKARSMHTPFSGHGGNLPIPSEMQINKTAMNGMMHGQMAGILNIQMHHQSNAQMNAHMNAMNSGVNTPMQSGSPNPSSQPPATINEAMEKLCDSMKRSAMSRSLVKQLSSRGLPKQGSNRQLPTRQNSGLMMGKQYSNKTLMDDSSGRGATPTPLRRMSSAKHVLQHPGRGVFRHDSQQSLNGQSNHHGLSLQIDGRNVGTF